MYVKLLINLDINNKT